MADDTLRLTRRQVRRVDEICIDEYGIPGLLLMEHAALALRQCVRDMIGGTPPDPVVIVCGGGNNGGDGYALARLLSLEDIVVRLLAAKPIDELDGDAATQANICAALKLPIEPATPDRVRTMSASLVVDALLGTGLASPPREDAVLLIKAMNDSGRPILAVDVPSGLDVDLGEPLGPAGTCVRAEQTCTFVAEKVGFLEASRFTGRVTVGDIGAPQAAVVKAMEPS